MHMAPGKAVMMDRNTQRVPAHLHIAEPCRLLKFGRERLCAGLTLQLAPLAGRPASRGCCS